MKIRVVDYIADFLLDNGIDTVFTVTGGGAMYLNDGLGHKKGLTCIYNHHEQASAIAAESYARINNKIAAVCVTTGPGGTNAITGVVGAWLDSIPMIVLSGQVRYDTTARSTGLNIRALGDQEFDITKAVECMTKYSEMIVDPLKIKFCLQKALYLAKEGRPGPCWLDIPLNVQGAYIETSDLIEFNSNDLSINKQDNIDLELINKIIEKLKKAKRPVINAGSAIRTSGGFEIFRRLIDKLNIPVVTGWNSIDLIENEHQLYVGRTGIMGDRAGNFAIQNSDLIISLGSRLSIRQVGYNYKSWAPNAYKIIVDIDREELKKPTIHADMPICADVRILMEELEYGVDKYKFKFVGDEWINKCREWKEKYPVVSNKNYEDKNKVNVYAFINELSKLLPEGYVTVVGNGSACVVGSQTYVIKNKQRFIINSAIASMGYDLPAAIGACIANDRKELICITGDGSIQMNIQELQTILTNKLPIKIFIINNDGYHSIRQTQRNYFKDKLVGVGTDSHDLSFPNFKKLAYAYGYKYFSCTENKELAECIKKVINESGALICEIFVNKEQNFEPKVTARKLEDGSMVSSSLEDMAPFLSREELRNNILK